MARPEKPVDWKLVDDLLICGCMGTEIAPHFNMHPDTFYNKVKDHYNMGFTEYSCQKKQEGDSFIRRKQFEKAIKGDNMMLIWLGKNRLNQSDSPKQDSMLNNIAHQFDSLMSQIKETQDLKIVDNNINNEQKS